ncbi:putative 4-coumarate--CoA ligase 1 [Oculina patagonica]
MASTFVSTRSLISAKRLLNHNGIRRLLLPRSFIALEKRSCSQFLRQAPLLPLSRLSGRAQQTTLCKFYSNAGIVKSEYTIEIPEISLTDFVLSKFSEYGDDIAMVDGASTKSYTYNELSTSIRKLSSALTKRGFKKGDVFALYLPNVPEYPILFFGVIALGGIATTLNPAFTEKEIAYQLKDSGAKYIMTVPAIADKAKQAAAEVGIKQVFVIGEAEGCEPLTSLLEDDGKAFPENVSINPKEDVCAMPYSSGTTGFPKGVMLTHHNIVSQLCMITHDRFRSHPLRGTTLGLLPFFHIFGMVVGMAQYLQRGGKVVCMQQFDGEHMLKLIQDFKIHCLYLVPPIITFLAKHPPVKNYDLTSIDTIISGAAPLGEELTHAVRENLPFVVALGQGYGLTETSPAAMLCPRNSCKPGAVGVLLPNLEGKVIDVQTGELLGPNQNGEVCIRGPTIMKGYLNNEKATVESITPDGWFHSGDTGYYDDEGHFYIVDRLKELIKYKGFQVPPAELEALLHSHPNVLDVAIVGIPDDEAGELPKAFIVPKGDITEKEIIDFVADKVSPHKKLRGGVEFIEQIPKTASGKILKRELRK